MPELPEVETVARGLAGQLAGRRLLGVDQRRPDLRFPMPERLPERLTGRRIERVGRRGKYVLVDLDDGQILVLHLGMSGRIVVEAADGYTARAHDHLVLHVEGGVVASFNDARRFGMVDLVAADALDRRSYMAVLGPEPFDPAFTPAVLSEALAGRRTPIKAALLDQKVVAGLGNIYVSEILFQARLAPTRLASTVAGRPAIRLHAAIRGVLKEAISAGGSSLRDYVQTNGDLGYFQHSWAVYDHEGERCPGCRCKLASTGGIRRIVQSGRSTFYCPTRQR